MNSGLIFPEPANETRTFTGPYLGTGEPSLDEVLADEGVRLLMECDGVTPDLVLGLIATVQRRVR